MRTIPCLPGAEAALLRSLVEASGAKLRLEDAADFAEAARRVRIGAFGRLPAGLRRELGLHATILPIGDLVVVRESLEGLSAGLEHPVGRDAAEASRVATREGSRRVAHAAFEYAAKNARRAVVVVHRADQLPLTDGLFLDAAREAAKHYPQIETGQIDPASAAEALVRAPEDFDVLLCTGSTGELLAAVAAGLTGGRGRGAQILRSEEAALFGPAEPEGPAGSARAAALLLEHANEPRAADRVNETVERILKESPEESGFAERLLAALR
jgi:isocitrate/isopropylmalate dehydrogenase